MILVYPERARFLAWALQLGEVLATVDWSKKEPIKRMTIPLTLHYIQTWVYVSAYRIIRSYFSEEFSTKSTLLSFCFSVIFSNMILIVIVS